MTSGQCEEDVPSGRVQPHGVHLGRSRVGRSWGWAQGEVTFWVGSGCALRVMLSQLAWHWTCLFADKLRSISRSPYKVSRLRRPLASMPAQVCKLHSL